MTKQQAAVQQARIRLAAARAARILHQDTQPLDPADRWAERYHQRMEGEA